MVQIAVEGCCHGSLDAIYRALRPDVQLLIICGDFQALRNETDLECMSVPKKYQQMGDFHRYYLLEKRAPVLTIFIGGNHESSLYMRELAYGGWVAPNIYYLGEYGCVWYKGLRICGASGIYNSRSFRDACGPDAPTYTLPYTASTVKSVYHVKPLGHLKLMLSGAADIVLSHDWPQWIWRLGNLRQLLRHKPYFKDDMASGRLGSPLANLALHHLQPRHWFSLHLHTRFTAEVVHGPAAPSTAARQTEESRNADEISLDMDSMDAPVEEAAPQAKDTQNTTTRFLALDKCLPHRRFLEHLSIEAQNLSHPSRSSEELFYDARAIAIHRVVARFLASGAWLSLDSRDFYKKQAFATVLGELEQSVAYEALKIADALEIPRNFTQTAPPSTEPSPTLQYWPSPQTDAFCRRFDVPPIVLAGE